MALAGGIDLGGTKIEARLFDTEADWASVTAREVETPRTDYSELLMALADSARWLMEEGAETVALGAPGLISADGLALTANLPANGKPLRADLESALGSPMPLINDCRAFTLSEARLGAGRGALSVLGLVIGTGLAGGFVTEGAIVDGPNGQAGEYGHTPMAHGVVRKHNLPWIACGCGRTGCYETFCSGRGIQRLSEIVIGQPFEARDLLRGAPELADAVFSVWADVMGNLLATLVLSFDPEVIVLGGGVSRVPGVAGRLDAALAPELLAGARAPSIVLAEGGDRSGARGAALFGFEMEANA